MLRAAVVTVILAVVGIVGIRSYLGLSFRDAYTADRALVEMHNLSRDTIQARTFLNEVPPPMPLDPSRSRLDLIRDRGVLRVGFLPDRLPFAFVNSEAQAVGFDLETARVLAEDLGVGLELVRLGTGNHLASLNDGTCDLIMSGLILTPSKPLETRFSRPYLDQTLAFLTLDHRRRDFATRKELQRSQGLRIGVVEPLADWIPRIETYLPAADIEVITSVRWFVRGETELRWNIFERWAVVGFVGVGGTRGNTLRYEDESGIVAGGVGGRWLFRPEDSLWVGVDVATGPEDTYAYIQVGHAW